MSDDLIHDVENSMRQERAERLWREYGPYILMGVVLAVLFTGGMAAYRSWNQSVDERNTSAMLQAMDDPDQAAALDKVLPGLRPGQKLVAQFSIAGLDLHNGKEEDALKTYNAIAADAKLPQLWRDLATWLGVRLDWSLHKDKTKAQGLIDRLQPLVADTGNGWTWEARLTAAEITAHGLGQYGQAQDMLAPILTDDSNAPDSLKQKARALNHLYGLEQTNPPPAAQKG
jgi:hypothetical protein